MAARPSASALPPSGAGGRWRLRRSPAWREGGAAAAPPRGRRSRGAVGALLGPGGGFPVWRRQPPGCSRRRREEGELDARGSAAREGPYTCEPASSQPPAAGSSVCTLNEWGTVSVRRTSPPGKGDRLVADPRVSPGDLEQGAGIEIGMPTVLQRAESEPAGLNRNQSAAREACARLAPAFRKCMC
ncbi:uncharacterized protein WM294_004430 [Sarcoramphus papa]